MPEPSTYQDIWVRWIHSTWENQNGWRTDIRPSVLNDATMTKALFVLDDGSCVFIPMQELRRTVSQKPIGANGSIIFNVKPSSKKIDEIRVEMTVLESRRKKAEGRHEFFEALRGV